MTLGGYVSANGNAFLTSSGDLTITGEVYAGNGVVQANSNGGALNLAGGNSYVEASGDVNLFGANSVDIESEVNSDGGNVNFSSYGNVTVGGNVTAANVFTGTSYGGTLTVNGTLTAGGGFGAVSTLTAGDLRNGAMAINGTINVGQGEIDFNAGTTFANDPQNSSITATTVNITAGTTATVQLSRFQYGGDEQPGVMNVTAQTIIASTDPDGEQGITPLNLTATGPVTLTGNINVLTLQGGNLTLTPNSDITVQSLNLTGPTGAFVIGDGVNFQLTGSNNATGAITLDGSPSLQIDGQLAVAGGISTTSADQTPGLNLSGNATLTATGSIALGAGFLSGYSYSTLTTNGTLTTTGDASVSTLNAHGGFTVGSLSAGTITLQNINGGFPVNPPASVVNGNVSAYRFDSTESNGFQLGQFTAGALLFGGMSDLSENPDGYSLTLDITGNFGVGAGGVAGYVTSGDFSGGMVAPSTTNYAGSVGGPGGTFMVTTTPNTSTGAAGDIRVRDNGTGIVPVLNASGGAFAPTGNQAYLINGTGGTGGGIGLQATGLLNVISGASLTAGGGAYTLPNFSPNTTPGTFAGGAGGTILLEAATTLTLTGGTGAAGTTTGPVVLDVSGGAVVNANGNGTGGAGGTVTLQSDIAPSMTSTGALTLTAVQVNASGGNNLGIVTGGDAHGGTINLTYQGTAAATATTVAITNSTLLASSGLTSTQPSGVGGTINITSLATSPPPSPTPPAILISGSTLVASQEQPPPPSPGPTGSPTPTPVPTPSYGSRVGGTIAVTSQLSSGPGISVQGASQLLALVDSRSTGAGGQISLTTGGADIAIAGGSTVRASGTNSRVTVSAGSGSGTITVDDSTVSTADNAGTLTPGGTVALTAGSAFGGAVSVTDGSTLSADVLNLQAPGASGSVIVDSSPGLGTTLRADTLTVQATGTGGTINVANSASTPAPATTLTATGTLSLLAPNTGGAITIGPTLNTNSVALNADMLKIFANGANGSIVINAGSTLSATTQLKLYASGSGGSITFEGGNITLNTGTVAGILAANTITIMTGTTVTANGSQPLVVYTNTPNYAVSSGGNGNQGGTFAGSARPTGTPSPLPSAPVASALRGGRPVKALAAGARVVAVGPGFALVATRAAAPVGAALPGLPGSARAAGTAPAGGRSAAELRRGVQSKAEMRVRGTP